MFKPFLTGLATCIALSVPATAAVLDFTKASLMDQTVLGQQTAFTIDYGSGASAGTVGFVLSSNQGPVTFQNAFPGAASDPAPAFCTNGTLACETGGAGVRNSVLSTGEQILLSLSAADQTAGFRLRIEEFYFLNLVSGSSEAALVRYNAGVFDEIFGATDASATGALTAAATSSDAANTIGVLFDAGTVSDGLNGFGDYSLAGIRFSLLLNGEVVDTSTEPPTGVVPLPASVLFLLAGIAGLGVVRGRKTKA